MSNFVFSSYDITTGLFDGAHFNGDPSHLPAQEIVRPNCSYVLGEYDYLSQCVDLETGNVIDYVPPKPGHRYEWDAGKKRWTYAPNAAEALWDAQQSAMTQINRHFEQLLANVRATYPSDEVTSWGKQEGEARAWTADNAAPTPLLSAIASARGVPFDLLVGKVIEKADLFAAASGQLIGARQHAEDRIGTATTAGDVAQIIADLFSE